MVQSKLGNNKIWLQDNLDVSWKYFPPLGKTGQSLVIHMKTPISEDARETQAETFTWPLKYGSITAGMTEFAESSSK